MCGKDVVFCSTFLGVTGSPPHVRERLFGSKSFFLANRITPACAGKTYECNRFTASSRDHPRMCGKDPLRKGGYFYD